LHSAFKTGLFPKILYKSRAKIQESHEFGNFLNFAPVKSPKILAKWWDSPPTVGQILG
jgi:hypothetical protein